MPDGALWDGIAVVYLAIEVEYDSCMAMVQVYRAHLELNYQALLPP